MIVALRLRAHETCTISSMEVNSSKQLCWTARDQRVCGTIAILLSLGASVVLWRICRAYFDILNGLGNPGGRLDSCGGFWEMQIVVPLLVLIAVVGGCVALRLKSWEKLALASIIGAPLMAVVCRVLVHYIITS